MHSLNSDCGEKVISVSTERSALLESEGHILVLGGPGSGKTTIAIKKAEREISSGFLKSGQRILFLSFARATVARVAEKSRCLIQSEDRQRLEINTYHGFAWNLLRSHGYLLRVGKPIALLPPPEAASRLAEIPSAMRDTEKQRLFDVEGLLHFDLFARITAGLLSRSQSLATIISDAYPIIILDEFQDTNSDEWALIQTLGKRSYLIALADPEQRIYEFRGADPRRIGEFLATYSPRQFDFGSENHRSTGTDILVFGNDLLSGVNKSKTYKDVAVTRYGFYRGRSQHFFVKAAVLEAITRRKKHGPAEWSLAVLVSAKRMMLAVSDYLLMQTDRLPVIHHDVALDAEGPSLSASLIAGLLEGANDSDTIARRLLLDLCSHMRGRSGNNAPPTATLEIVSALSAFIESGKIRGKNRKQLVTDAQQIADKRLRLKFSGDPGDDWLLVRSFLSEASSEHFKQVAEDAKYLRLLRKGAALRARLGELWRSKDGYDGATLAVRDALLQEHFSVATSHWTGVHVMTIHKAKGKEFDEVIIYEGTHQGRIVRQNATESDVAQARLSLRVAITRARLRTTILTPKNDACPFLC